MLPKIYNFVANFVNPYSKLYKSNIELYEVSLRLCKSNNDIVFGTWANFLMHFSHFLSGDSLDNVHKSIDTKSNFLLASGDAKMIAIFRILEHSVNTLQGNEQKDLNIDSILTGWEKDSFYPALAWYAVIKAKEYLILGEFDKGLEVLEKHVHVELNDVIMFAKIELHFIRSLLLFSKYDKIDSKNREVLLKDISEQKAMYKASPRIFKFHKLLLDALISQDNKSSWDVGKKFDQALNEAKLQNNALYSTLAALLVARYWKHFNFLDVSNNYFDVANVALNQWGAYAIKSLLQHKDSSSSALLKEQRPQTDYFNHRSILKSFNIISEAQSSKDIITVLMQTILENAIATKAVFIVKNRDDYLVQASVDFDGVMISFHNHTMETSSLVPKKIVKQAILEEHYIRLEKPAVQGDFQLDPYIKLHKPSLSLVVPVKQEGEVQALLYLENRDLVTSFSDENIQTLELLLLQAMISYKNQMLYTSLTKKEASLSKAQEIANVGSWSYDNATDMIQWSEQTYRIYEMDPFSEDIELQWFKDHIHPDDIEYVDTAIAKAFSHEKYYDVIHRIITNKGNIKTVHQRAETFMDGDTIHMSGTIHDISEQKQTEAMPFS
jgi:PAS domain S-box-containing protein